MTKSSCYRKEKFEVVAYRKSNYCLIGEPSFSFIRIFFIRILGPKMAKF